MCSWRLLFFLFLGAQGQMSAQAPSQLERSLGAAVQRFLPVSEEPRVAIWLRAIRAGAASDRDRMRQKMIGSGRWRVPELIAELRRSRSQMVQRQILLVLMELGDRRSTEVVQGIASGRIRGVEGNAGLVLGRMGGAGSLKALRRLVRSANKGARLQGLLALGRLRHPRSAAALRERLASSRSVERRACLLALAMSGGATLVDLDRYLFGDQARGEATRRVAVLALGGAVGEEVERALLKVARSDPDALCRQEALEGLAARRVQLPPKTLLRLPFKVTDDVLIARATLLAGLSAAPELWPSILSSARHRDLRPRVAAAAAAAFHGGPKAGKLLARLLGDERIEVKEAALVASAILAATTSNDYDFLSLVSAKNERFSRLALAAAAYRGSEKTPRRLRSLAASLDLPKGLRERAKELAAGLSEEPDLTRTACRFELQVAFDRLGAAPSWNHIASINDGMQKLLGLDDARSALGGGTTPTGATRGGAAPARRHSKEAEDLKFHFDRYPYVDRLDTTPLELPPQPGSRWKRRR